MRYVESVPMHAEVSPVRWIVVVVVAALAVGLLILAIGGGEDDLPLDADGVACREGATAEWEAFHSGFVRDPERAAVLSAYESAGLYAVAVCG